MPRFGHTSPITMLIIWRHFRKMVLPSKPCCSKRWSLPIFRRSNLVISTLMEVQRCRTILRDYRLQDIFRGACVSDSYQLHQIFDWPYAGSCKRDRGLSYGACPGSAVTTTDDQPGSPDTCCDLDYVPNVARAADADQPLRFALSLSSGFGGINTALVLARNDALDEASAASPQGQTANPAARLRRRVVITGVGVVAPNGIGKAAFWTAVCAGRSVMGPPVRHYDMERPLQCVGEIKTSVPRIILTAN